MVLGDPYQYIRCAVTVVQLLHNKNNRNLFKAKCLIMIHSKQASLILVFVVGLSLGYTNTAKCQCPGFEWVRGSTSDASFSIARGIGSDTSGNIYVVGYFQGTVTFDSTSLISNGANDIYILKYDTAGNILWGKSFGGNYSDYVWSVDIDEIGNLLIYGRFFSDTLSFGANKLIRTGGSEQVYAAMFDNNGNSVWAKNVGSVVSNGWINGVAIGSGSRYILGVFYSDSVTIDSFFALNSGGADFFLIKLDLSGNVLWLKSFGGAGDEGANDIIVDAAENVYLTGSYDDTMDFNTVILTTNAFYNSYFIVKMDGNGNTIWAQSAGGPLGAYGVKLSVDKQQNIVAVGSAFSGPITFGSFTLDPGYDCSFVVQYDSTGYVRWADFIEGVTCYGIAIDPFDNVYLTGYLDQYWWLIFGMSQWDNEWEMTRAFVVMYNNYGVPSWAIRQETDSSGSGTSIGYGITADHFGRVYIAGYTDQKLYFGGLTLPHASAGNGKSFFTKIDPSGGVNPNPKIIPGGPTTFCNNSMLLLLADQDYNKYLWSNDSTTKEISVNQTGAYMLSVYDNYGCTGADTIDVVSLPAPSKPLVTQNMDTLVSTPAPAYQWYKNNNSIPGATNQTYVITQSANYTVKVTEASSCFAFSDSMEYLLSGIGIDQSEPLSSFEVFPNPNPGLFTVSIELTQTTEIILDMNDILGTSVIRYKSVLNKNTHLLTFDSQHLAEGIYFLKAHVGKRVYAYKIFITK